MKLLTRSVATILVLAVMVLADNPHFKRPPRLIDNGFTATASGALAGLGNGNIIVTLSFPNAVGTTICQSPGGNDAPGQNPAVPAAVSGSQLITRVKNGTATFSVTTDPPPPPTPQSAGCANPNWVARFDNITFGAGTLTVQQETVQGNGIYEVVLVLDVFL